jgi:hypothetical protein
VRLRRPTHDDRQFTREPLRVIYGRMLGAPPTHVAWPLGDLVEVIAA